MPGFETIAVCSLIVMAGIAAWFATQRLIGRRPCAAAAIAYRLHDLTAGANAWLHRHPRAANTLLIASSLWIDLVTLFVLAYAILGPSLAPFIGLLLLFALRQVAQMLVALPAPPGIIWRDPGFPSLFVTYAVGNDFFFSGHTALAVFGAIQLATLGWPLLTLLAAVMAVLLVALVIVLRAHWTLDVLAGLFAALLVGVWRWPH